MGELMQTNDFVYVTDVDEFDIEAFKSWYQSLNKEYYPYSSEYLQIQKMMSDLKVDCLLL